MTKPRKIAVLEIVALPGSWVRSLVARQYAGVFSQCIAAWCHQAGHEVTYRIHCGRGDLPDLGEPDVLFVSCTSQCSALAYIAAKRYPKSLRVIGGPHARCYPGDCRRFFDVVTYGGCDQDSILALAEGCETWAEFPSLLSSVEQRLPFIRQAQLVAGRIPVFPVVGLLSSIGCGGGCSFCVDYNNKWHPFPMDRWEEDLGFIQNRLKWPVMFHDPNLKPHLDQVLTVMERVGWRTPWAFECNLEALTEDRLQRLWGRNCQGVGVGIESWTAYGHKTGTLGLTPAEKYEFVVERLGLVHGYIPTISANQIWPSDTDYGSQPLDLSHALLDECPWLWTPLNMPVAFGNTPLYAKLHREGRVLPLPFAFQKGYLNIVPKHYSPADTLDGFAELSEGIGGWRQWRNRTKGRPWRIVIGDLFYKSEASRRARQVLRALEDDPDMQAFHAGVTECVPDWYWREHDRLLGRFAGQLTREELTPIKQRTGD